MPRTESYTIADVIAESATLQVTCAQEEEGAVYYVSTTYNLLEDGTGNPVGGGRREYRLAPGDPQYGTIHGTMVAILAKINADEGM